MKVSIKKSLAALLALVIVMTPLTNVKGVSAVTYSTAEYEDIVGSLLDGIDTFATNFNNVQDSQGIYTQLYQARQIFSYATYLYVASFSAEKDQEYRECVGSSLGLLVSELSNMIMKYNADYFGASDEYKGEKFTQATEKDISIEALESFSDANIVSECKKIEKWCIAIAKQYVAQTLEPYADTAKAADADDEEENKSLCIEIYRGLAYGLTCIEDVKSYMGVKGDKSLSISGYAFKNRTVERWLKNDINKYEEVYSKGKIESTIKDGGENVISIDPTKTIIENMADVYIEQDESSPTYGVISIAEDPKLSLAYLGILASGATYTPFESYVGDSRFMAALDSLCEDQETVALLNSYYNSLKLYKKPLYFRNLNTVGTPEGQAELKSIAEIFELISSGAAGSLCTANGNLCVNTNTGDWVYTTEQMDSSTSYVLKESLGETEQVESTLGDENSDSGGGSSDSADDVEASGATVKEVAKVIYSRLSAEGYNDAAICGILGNIQRECDFVYTNETGSHWGLAQWGTSFKKLHDDWESKYKNDYNAQIDYLIATLNGDYSHVKTKLLSLENTASGAVDACDIFCVGYEGCTSSDTPHSSPNVEYNGPWYPERHGSWYQALEERREFAKDFFVNKLDELKGTTTQASLNSIVAELSGLFGIQTAYASPVGDGTGTGDGTGAGTGTGNSTETGDGTGTGDSTGEDTTEDITDTEEEETESVPSIDNTGAETTEDSLGQTQDNSSTVITDYNSKGKNFKDAISASRIISDESRLNGPALLFGSIAQREIDNMTTAIYTNVLNSVGNYNISDMDSEYLYINAFGDIVTASDLVIFPGILNPLLYGDDVSYNPYTVAFMNSYPANIRNSVYYTLSSKSDIGKYCLFLDTPESNEESAISGYNNDEDDTYVLSDGTYEFALLNSTTGVKSTQSLLSKPIFGKFIYGSFEKAATFRLQKYLFCYNIAKQKDVNAYIPLIENASVYADGKQVFPYDFTTDTDSSASKVIANNMYQYLTTDFLTKEIGNHGKLHDNWILHYILISGYEGTSDIDSYKNNMEASYDGFTMSNTSRVISHIVEFSQKLLDSLSAVNCVLGLQNSYEDSLLGKIVTVIRDYWLIFFIAFLFVVLIAVMKARKDLLQSGFLVIACSFAAYVFVYYVPVYLPMFYNLIVNNVSDRVAYEVLLKNNEYNEGTADNIVDVDEDGKLKYNTSSITLYRLPSAQLEQYYENLGITLRDATGGNTFIVDQYAGLFLEGDSLKMSSDVLFGTLSIQNDPSTGQLHAYKTVSNNMDYYTPYYQIVDSLIEKLNKITEIYDVNHSTTKLRNGSRADNFRTYTYFNSPIFVSPDKMYADLELDTTGWSEEEINSYTKKQEAIINALIAEFGDNSDWLGMYDILVTNALKPGSNYQGTLWFNTMCDVGYYRDHGNGWEVDTSNMNALIYYINYQTKNFVYDIKNYVGDMSDEAIIEVVALRAVLAMTQEASDFTHWMYPFSVNYPEFTLGDITVSTFVEKYSDYVKNNYSIVSYINDKYGWFNLIMFDLMNIIMFIVTWLVKLLSTVLYLLLMLILLIQMFGNNKYSSVVKGFVKCSTIIMIILLLQVLAVSAASKLVGNVIGIYVVLAMDILAMYLLIIVITSIMFNFTEFGNSALNAKVSGFTSAIQNMKNISINTTNIRNQRSERNPAIVLPDKRISKYDFDVDTDDQYDMQIRNEDINSYNTNIEKTSDEDELEFYTDDTIDNSKDEYEF